MAWLLVEDDTDIRNVVAVMMSVWGEKPLPFPDGSAAWNWLDSVANGTFTGELPDLALMDIRMPGYTGDKIAARIRQTAALKDIPIVLMTAFSLTDTEIKEMMDHAGVDHLINKPLPDMEIFRSTLYKVRDERKERVAKAQAMPAAAPTPSASAGQPANPVQTSAVPAASPAPAAPAPAPTPISTTPAPTQGTISQPASPPTTTGAPGAISPGTSKPLTAPVVTPPANNGSAPSETSPKKE